jgi:uncharacterized membrane protein
MIPQIRFYKGVIDASGCISNGWNLIKPNYGMYLGIAVLAWVLIACIPCLNVFLMGPVTAGVYYVMLREMRDEPVDFGMMFQGFQRFVPAMVVGLIQSVPGIIFQGVRFGVDITQAITEGISGKPPSGGFYASDGSDIAIAGGFTLLIIVLTAVFLIFSIAWGITFSFALPILAEYDLGPIEAIKLSARAGWGNAGGLVVLWIFQGLIGLLGALALCIGVFFVLPVLYAASAFAYRQVFPLLDAPVMRNVPPSPSEYGGSYGRGI